MITQAAARRGQTRPGTAATGPLSVGPLVRGQMVETVDPVDHGLAGPLVGLGGGQSGLEVGRRRVEHGDPRVGGALHAGRTHRGAQQVLDDPFVADEADDPVVGVEAALQVGEEGEAAALRLGRCTSRSARAPAPRSATGALGGPPYRPPTS